MATYLVDLENTGLAGLTGIDELSRNDKVIVFYGTRTGSIAFDKHVELTKAKAEVTYTKTERVAKNYLDFQLVTYLGYLIGSGQERVYYIISKDKGYDSCIEFWKKTDKQVTISRREALQSAKKEQPERAALPEPEKPAAEPAKRRNRNAAKPVKEQERPAAEKPKQQEGPATEKPKQQEKPAAERPKQQEGPAAERPKQQERPAAERPREPEKSAAENPKEQGKPVQRKTAARPTLPESVKKKIRKAVKDEKLKGGSYMRLYDYVLRLPDKQNLNIALVKAFQQEKGNRLYKEILDIFVEYHKQNTAE